MKRIHLYVSPMAAMERAEAIARQRRILIAAVWVAVVMEDVTESKII